MSLHQYEVFISPNTDILRIRRDDDLPISWADSDFQAWNNAQSVPFQLSVAQQIIQTLKQMSYPQWQANVTAAQKDRILYELVQRALRSEIV